MERDMEPKEKINKRSFGKSGEEAAANYLQANGYKLIERNYQCGRIGEIDIIAAEKEYICFVEVKTRTGNLFGTPSEAVDARKQANIRKLAWIYLKKCGKTECNVRFDVVEVLGHKYENKLVVENINIIKDAF